MNKSEQEEIRALPESKFMDRWTKRAKDLDEAKEDCRWFRQEYDRRLVAAKVADLSDEEVAQMAEAIEMRVAGIDSEESVNGG